MTLNEKINAYAKRQADIEELENEQKALRDEIIAEMKELSLSKEETEEATARLDLKTTIRYRDEAGLISFLRNHQMKDYIVTKVNTTAFNKEFKKGGKLFDDTQAMCEQSVSDVLTVKSK